MPVSAAPEQSKTTRVSKVRALASRAVNTINTNASAVFIAITLVYFAIALGISSYRLFWFDELVTFYIAKLGSARAIWAALAQGADPNPPLSHLLTMWSMRLFGEGHIAVRIPAMLASFLGVWCLYLFLRKRVPAIFVACGVFFYIATHAMDYSYESRSYAFMLGFAMLSLVMFREAIEGKHKMLATAGLALALSAGLSSNYYGVLAFFPIAVGEVVRTIQNRKLEFRIYAALACASASLLPYMGLVHSAVSRFAPFAWNKPRLDFVYNSYDSLIDTLVIPTAGLIIAAVAVYLFRRFRGQNAGEPVLPRHEYAALAVQMMYPVIAYAIAVARAGMLSPRFVLPICFSVSIAVAIAGKKMFSKNAIAAIVLLFVCGSWAIARNIETAMEMAEQRKAMLNLRDRLPATGPLVVSDSLLALPLVHYAAPQDARRIEFPVDIASVREFKHDDSAEQNLLGGGTLFPLHMISAPDIAQQQDYTIVAGQENWFIKKYQSVGIPLEKVAVDPGARYINDSFAPLGAAEPFFFIAPRKTSVPGSAAANSNTASISH